MKPTADKNRKLISQYPFLKAIIGAPLDPMSPSVFESDTVADLTIKVEKADANLMYRQGKNTGLEDNRNGSTSWSMPMEGPRNGQAGKRGNFLFAVGESGGILHQLDWKNETPKQPMYGWNALWTGTRTYAKGGKGYTDPIWKETKYLVWVTVEAWYKFIKGFEVTPFGDFIDRTMTITIYSAPEQGFEKLQEEANVYEHLWLDNDVILRGSMRNDHDILYINGMLAELCHQFKTDVYDNGMRDIADSHPQHRIAGSGNFGPVKVLVGEMCGYERIMLGDDFSYITFQIRPGFTHAYVLGMQGRLPQLRHLVRIVINDWNHREGARQAFSYDQKVTVA